MKVLQGYCLPHVRLVIAVTTVTLTGKYHNAIVGDAGERMAFVRSLEFEASGGCRWRRYGRSRGENSGDIVIFLPNLLTLTKMTPLYNTMFLSMLQV